MACWHGEHDALCQLARRARDALPASCKWLPMQNFLVMFSRLGLRNSAPSALRVPNSAFTVGQKADFHFAYTSIFGDLVCGNHTHCFATVRSALTWERGGTRFFNLYNSLTDSRGKSRVPDAFFAITCIEKM